MIMTTTLDSPSKSLTHRPFKVILGYAIKSLFGVAFYGAILFLAAGTLRWPGAWIYLVLFLLVLMASSLFTNAELLRDERGVGQQGRKTWDLSLVSLYGIVTTIAVPILAGLDWRYGWAASIPTWLVVIAGVLYVLGWAFGLWAMAVNRFFSKVVRIQHERGHHVIDVGPYQYVRHPGYTGGIIHNLGTPLILGSWWAMAPAVLAAVMLVIRTALEDRTLHTELEGYSAYSQRTRYRLVPGIW
jgi:protein-S-isoprenylcysteine O-methyltransferase Ste14